MLERKKISESVRQEITRQLTPPPKLVSLTESERADLDAVILNEGLGSGIVKLFATITGGVAFGAFGAGLSYFTGIGVTALVTSLGLVTATAAAATGGAAALALWVAFVVTGAKAGYNISRFAEKSMSRASSMELHDTIQKRDTVVVAISGMKDAEAVKKEAALFDKLTEAQKKAARKLKTDADSDYKRGLISSEEYRILMDMAATGMQGLLTYCTDSRALNARLAVPGSEK